MFKRILLATDGSPAVERIVLYAGHLARVEGAELVVVHAYELPPAYATVEGFEQLQESYQRLARALVDDVVRQLREDGAQALGEVRTGPAAVAILAAAADHDSDLIVMGTRGHGSVQEMIGSVSAQVLRFARCPVLQVQ
jgi:nucleotide-binding universal stress UspA family protein